MDTTSQTELAKPEEPLMSGARDGTPTSPDERGGALRQLQLGDSLLETRVDRSIEASREAACPTEAQLGTELGASQPSHKETQPEESLTANHTASNVSAREQSPAATANSPAADLNNESRCCLNHPPYTAGGFPWNGREIERQRQWAGLGSRVLIPGYQVISSQPPTAADSLPTFYLTGLPSYVERADASRGSRPHTLKVEDAASVWSDTQPSYTERSREPQYLGLEGRHTLPPIHPYIDFYLSHDALACLVEQLCQRLEEEARHDRHERQIEPGTKLCTGDSDTIDGFAEWQWNYTVLTQDDGKFGLRQNIYCSWTNEYVSDGELPPTSSEEGHSEPETFDVCAHHKIQLWRPQFFTRERHTAAMTLVYLEPTGYDLPVYEEAEPPPENPRSPGFVKTDTVVHLMFCTEDTCTCEEYDNDDDSILPALYAAAADDPQRYGGFPFAEYDELVDSYGDPSDDYEDPDANDGSLYEHIEETVLIGKHDKRFGFHQYMCEYCKCCATFSFQRTASKALPDRYTLEAELTVDKTLGSGRNLDDEEWIAAVTGQHKRWWERRLGV